MLYNSNLELCFNKIRDSISEATLYEQLAEECTELAKACLKKSRKLRNENYTPKTMEEINDNLEEEYTDVRLSAAVCEIVINWNLYCEKAKRWAERIENGKTNTVL